MTKMPDAEARRRDKMEILRLLARGEKEIEAGEGHDLDAVFAEVDALLAQWEQDD